jgi:hypothetical protein
MHRNTGDRTRTAAARHGSVWNGFQRNTECGSGFSPAQQQESEIMGRGLLLWMLGIPLPIIILLALFR